MSHLLRLSGFGQDQSEQPQADLLVLGGSFTDLKGENKKAAPLVNGGGGMVTQLEKKPPSSQQTGG